VSLVSRLVVGAVLQREGAQVRRFGITFLFFLIPRFAVDMTDLHKLDREGKTHVFAAALRTRFLLFAVGTLFWAATRQSGWLLSDIAAIVGQFGLFSFLISAFPLFPGEGYRLMCAYFDQPMLRERSFAYIFRLGRAGNGPTSATERWAFVLYGIGSLLTSAFLATLVAAYTSAALEGHFGGTGVAIFLGLFALVVAWFLVTRGRSKKLRAQIVADMMAKRREPAGKKTGPTRHTLPVPVPAVRGAPRQRDTLPASIPAGERQAYRPLPGMYGDNAPAVRRNRWIRRGIFIAALAGTIYAAFLPYNYETGGDFVILPQDRVEVVARVPNELAEVMVEEGAIVNKGDLLAIQINIRERHTLEVSKAELAKARAQLQRLRDGATPEEIRVAEEQVERYKVALPFLKSEYERAMALGERGTMSISQKERIISDYETGKADLRSAEASLERVRAKAQDTDIAMAQADVDRLESEVAYAQVKLNDTRMFAPVSGRVVFDGDEPVPGKYYEIGDLLMEIEDHTVARAEIKVPEADVGLIQVGEQVRLKAWAWPDQEHIGVVSAIAPVAETEEFGQVVRIKTSLPNEDGLFRPGMTGYAKVTGAQMPMWEAFSRLFVRFILIEVWGWIP
jgi:multidrug resistance efflux pump